MNNNNRVPGNGNRNGASSGRRVPVRMRPEQISHTAPQKAVSNRPSPISSSSPSRPLQSPQARPAQQNSAPVKRQPPVNRPAQNPQTRPIQPYSAPSIRQNSFNNPPKYSNRQPGPNVAPKQNNGSSTGIRILATVGKVFAFIMTFIVVLLIVLAVSFKMICSNSNPSAQELFVRTVLETGQLKFLANVFTSQADLNRIIEEGKLKKMDEDVDASLIEIPKGSSGSVDISGGNGQADEKDIEIIDIAGASYHATLMIIKDPSRVSVATIYPWRTEGVTLDQIAKDSGALAAMNGGLYNSYNNSGGMPYGVVVADGEIQYNDPTSFVGLFLIGLTEDNILEIIDINGMNAYDTEKLIRDKKIRDAVTFQEETSDANNHFVQLIINGEKRDLGGKSGSGLNPRTAIGQRSDGAILMLVTDGRGYDGHLGASASDLINIMSQYGAVNAANLDGGSSSCMYYDGEYLMTSVTFYYSNSSWKLPLAFIVK